MLKMKMATTSLCERRPLSDRYYPCIILQGVDGKLSYWKYTKGWGRSEGTAQSQANSHIHTARHKIYLETGESDFEYTPTPDELTEWGYVDVTPRTEDSQE
jgi:hypothetical protein